ncbi:protein argonaute 16-like [Hevea brasiliensis]|uniref:protein argonaute 16-like n=1 Tax=Hevea brasiliensis TaxID=3981 RepID=UPI0025EE2569|nr:protein argonaute 16-like [Hevea brasiliensis]
MEDAGGSCPKPTKRSIIARPGFGSSGHPIPLLSNHFKVSVNVTDVVFYQYSVSITAEDNRVVDEKRKIIDRLCQTYSCELAGKSFACDGEKTLYSLVRLPQSWMEFTVVPEESIAKRCNPDGGRSFAATSKRPKRRLRSETFEVEIVYAAKIPLNSFALSLQGNETNNNTRDALKVLDTILKNRQSGCLLLRQTFFHDDPKNFTDVGGGITGVRPWKKKCLSDFGIVTQCIYPSTINDQYLTNVLLKINSKLGGINSLLAIEDSMQIPLIKDTPTMILGMGLSLGSAGRSDIPSVAAVVGSLYWPHISRYRASVRVQSPKEEMIDGLYNPLANGKDDGMMRKLLEDFCHTSNGNKPKHIIVFRNGMVESQFSKVLNVEVDQILKAYQDLFKSEVDVPKFTVIVAQKDRHTKLFQDISSENVPFGQTIVDTEIVHPRNYDFYLCANCKYSGTSRPAHYHILLDEIGFSPDELQNLIHALSYVNQRSTTAIRTVAPLRYANLAARQMGQFMKFEDNLFEISSGQGPVPELPRLHKNVASSMFFC